MTAPIRTAHDAEPDVLHGLSIDEAKAEAGRLAGEALQLTIYLARPRAGLTFAVRANLEHERNGLEMAAADLESRIAEHEGQILQIRQAGPPLTERALLVRSRI